MISRLVVLIIHVVAGGGCERKQLALSVKMATRLLTVANLLTEKVVLRPLLLASADSSSAFDGAGDLWVCVSSGVVVLGLNRSVSLLFCFFSGFVAGSSGMF